MVDFYGDIQIFRVEHEKDKETVNIFGASSERRLGVGMREEQGTTEGL
jgi:hypothetical protein